MEEIPPTKNESSAEAEHAPEELEAAVAAVIAEENFVPELCKCRGEGPWNPLFVAPAVLRGLGMDGDKAKDLLRPDK